MTDAMVMHSLNFGGLDHLLLFNGVYKILFIMSSNAADVDDEVFVYTGTGADVPQDVVRVRVDPSVTTIPAYAFDDRNKLAEVALCEGLVEIGERSFGWCGNLITKINVPNSLRRIKNYAFSGSLRCPIHLHDGIESIGRSAFLGCIFTNFRVPSRITVISESLLWNCTSLFSVEMPLTVTAIQDFAFHSCHCLRNVAFPPDAVINNNIFNEATDLLQLCGSITEIISELKY
jgi:hypothetical protein